MIIIKNREVANHFTRTFMEMKENIVFEDLCLISDNKFFIFEHDMTKMVEIDLETSSVKILPAIQDKLKNCEKYEAKDGDLASSMCNVVNVAVTYWKNFIPFKSKRDCKNLSMAVTRALRPFEMSFELTLNCIRIFHNKKPISFEQAVNILL